jgi:hypothetical protein
MSSNSPLLPVNKEEERHNERKNSFKGLTAGTLALVCLIFAWVIQAEVSKSLQHGSASVKPYNKPFFITILNQSLMVSAFFFNFLFLSREEVFSIKMYLVANGLSIYKVAVSCIQLGIVYCASTFLWFSSMGQKSVSVSIASGIYNSSVVWVFLLSLFFHLEFFSWLKSGGVILAIVGVVLSSITSTSHSLHPSNSTSNVTTTSFIVIQSSQIGSGVTFQLVYLEVVGSAMLYACFEVMLKLITNAAQKRAGKNSGEDVPVGVANIFTGGVGLVHIFVLSFLFLPLNYFGWEIFEWPTIEQWKMLALNAGMGTMFNVSFVASIALMSPTLVSVSCLLTIPIAAIADLMLNSSRDQSEQVQFTITNIFGLCFICLGFIAFTVRCRKE